MNAPAAYRSWVAPRWPDVAIGISSRGVAAVRVHRSPGGDIVARHAVESLPPGAITPALNAPNVGDPGAAARAVAAAFDRLGVRPKRVSLVIPDIAAKVSLVRFDAVPPSAADLERFIRWQVRKSVPFRVGDGQVSWTPGAQRDPPAGEFVVAVARRDIVEEYEGVCATAGAQAGLVDLATFNLINLVLAAGAPSADTDWLLVHLASDYTTLAILRGASLIFFRNRAADMGGVSELVHQTAMYYEDRLGGPGIARVVLSGAGADAESRSRDELEARLGVSLESIDPGGVVTLGDRAAPLDVLDAVASPLGLVLRDRVA